MNRPGEYSITFVVVGLQLIIYQLISYAYILEVEKSSSYS